MKSLTGIIIIIFISVHAVAQDFTIIYETKFRGADSTKSVFIYPSVTLAIREPLSYCYYPTISGGKKLKDNLPLGSSYWPKSSFTNSATCLYIFQAGPLGKPKKQRLVVDSCDKGTWQFFDETKVIAGYICKKAIRHLDGTNKIAWYAPDLPATFAPFFSHNLPGTILEYWYDNGMAITTAIIVSKGAFKIVEPNFCERISRSEYDKKNKAEASNQR